MTAEKFIEELNKYANIHNAAIAQRFFKTSAGEYGEGDVFVGVRVPKTRKVCADFKDLPLKEIQMLFDSEIHEHRLAAAILLASQYKRSKNSVHKKAIFDLYLLNLRKKRINNWDIVDVTASHVIGNHLLNRPKDILFQLAKSDNLWERRASIISTFVFIKNGDPEISLELAEILLFDDHDLIQKAVGWYLREIGKRIDESLLTNFLDANAAVMPRTTLRYSLEKLIPEKRKYYMSMKNYLNN